MQYKYRNSKKSGNIDNSVSVYDDKSPKTKNEVIIKENTTNDIEVVDFLELGKKEVEIVGISEYSTENIYSKKVEVQLLMI